MDEKELQRISQQAARVGVDAGTTAEAFRRVAEMSAEDTIREESGDQMIKQPTIPPMPQVERNSPKNGELIYRQAATQTALEFIVEYLGGAFDEDLQRKLIERMNALPFAQSEQRWIPVSERLPIDAGHYLCSFKKPNRIDRICVDLAYWTGGRWYGYMADEICAWMPLPEPYEEVK